MSNFHISQHVASVWDMLLQATGVKQAFFSWHDNDNFAGGKRAVLLGAVIVITGPPTLFD